LPEKAYLKPTAACQTNARRKKNKGISGRTSTKGSNMEYASGSFAKKNGIFILLIVTLLTQFLKISLGILT